MWKYISATAQAAGSAPLFTWHHADSRIELSGLTFLNAVSKAANFLVDGMEIEVAEEVYVELGNHWQAPVWQCAVLASGAVLSDKQTKLNIVTSTALGEVENQVAVVSRDPFGMPEQELPAGVLNASAEVRGFGDYFAPRTETKDNTLLTSWGVDISQARELVVNLADRNSIALGQGIAITQPSNLRLGIQWQCFFSIFNQSPIVLLDGDLDRSKVEQQEKVTQFIDL